MECLWLVWKIVTCAIFICHEVYVPDLSLLALISGYLTNTGIKFMLIVENVQISEDGVRFDATPSFVNQSLHREADLKHMFVSQ